MKKLMLNVLGFGFIITCWFIMIRHMNYLGQIHRPSVGELKETVNDIADILGATVVSPMVVLDKSSFISVDTNIQYGKLNEIGVPNLTSRLEAENWEPIILSASSSQRFCNDGIVLEFELPQPSLPLRNSYPLEVSWGSGDVLCKTSKLAVPSAADHSSL